MSQTIGERIRAVRGTQGVGEFADALGVNRKTVTRWEANEALPDGASLLTLLDRFGVDPKWLLTGSGDMPSAPALTREEEALLDNFRHCPPDARRAIKATSDALAKYEGCCVTKKGGKAA